MRTLRFASRCSRTTMSFLSRVLSADYEADLHGLRGHWKGVCGSTANIPPTRVPARPHVLRAPRCASALRNGDASSKRCISHSPNGHNTGNIESVVASALGSEDLAAVRKHLQDPSLDTLIDDDAIMGLHAGSPGTPTSFITAGGQTEKVDGALTYAGMQRRLDGLP